MKLKKLIKDLPILQIKGSKEIEITGISANSKLVAPGNLFIARKGKLQDGVQFIPEAIEAGAAAILTDIYDPSFKNIVQLIHPDVSNLEGPIAASYYQNPSDELMMVGITGTNGKTTTTFLIKHLLDRLQKPCGLIGTIEYIIGHHRYQATRTTPDVTSNQKMLRDMVNQGCKACVMEVTSHALDQNRMSNIEIDVALFSNLTLDHLDYHQTMENYCDAKNKLFRSLNLYKKKKGGPKKMAIINGDSPWSERVSAGCKAPIFTYGFNSSVDLKASNIELTGTGTFFDITFQGKTRSFSYPLVGRFNVYNCLAAISVGLSQGVSCDDILEIMREAPPIPGRMQKVPNDLGLKIYVDFAHSDDALTNVLECLQEFKKGRMITVFGCGGDRDSSKRSKMAQAAEEFCDLSIITSDNPRSEDPAEIAKQIVQGFKSKEHYIIELDRQKAIEKAISLSTPDDVILIAGKGHETMQVFSYKTIEFDDAKVAAQLCQKFNDSKISCFVS
jgi:UDP-N-acetylmuramoyl-L-alanyl-D-glutamate--2,6-diaminopimelate ligase